MDNLEMLRPMTVQTSQEAHVLNMLAVAGYFHAPSQVENLSCQYIILT